MKSYIKLVLLVVLFAGLACMASAASNKKSGGKKAGEGFGADGTLKGVLVVSTDDKGVVEAFIDPKMGFLYNIVVSSLTQNAGDLKAMSGMEVLVKGSVKDVDGKKWLTVDGLIAKADGASAAPDSSKKEKKKKK